MSMWKNYLLLTLKTAKYFGKPPQITVVGDQGVLTQEVLGEVAQVALPHGQSGIFQHILEVQQEQPQQIASTQPPPKPPKPPELCPPVRKVK